MPAPPPRSAPRSPARRRAPACWRAATVCPARPYASGASAVPPTARTARRVPTSCPGRRARRSVPEEERAIVCALRRATGFPLDDLTFIVSHFLPHLNRDAVYRILKAEGLNRLPPAERTRKPHSAFKDYDLGFVHVDVKHLPKLRTSKGESRKRYLYVAIDRASRF